MMRGDAPPERSIETTGPEVAWQGAEYCDALLRAMGTRLMSEVEGGGA